MGQCFVDIMLTITYFINLLLFFGLYRNCTFKKNWLYGITFSGTSLRYVCSRTWVKHKVLAVQALTDSFSEHIEGRLEELYDSLHLWYNDKFMRSVKKFHCIVFPMVSCKHAAILTYRSNFIMLKVYSDQEKLICNTQKSQKCLKR